MAVRAGRNGVPGDTNAVHLEPLGSKVKNVKFARYLARGTGYMLTYHLC